MLKGTVSFRAEIKGNGLTFPRVAWNPKEPGVDRVELEGPNGDEILSSVHLESVATEDEGKAIAARVNTAALDRISFFHGLATENEKITGVQFSPVDPQPGVLEASAGSLVITGWAPKLVLGIPAATVQGELEGAAPPGEANFGLFRSALQSASPVEAFMHMYHILMMLFGDRQSDVDAFVTSEDPTVPQTQHPLKYPGVMETIYTRLRNELAHKRAGVNLQDTKLGMANRLGGLVAVTKRAIELYS